MYSGSQYGGPIVGLTERAVPRAGALGSAAALGIALALGSETSERPRDCSRR